MIHSGTKELLVSGNNIPTKELTNPEKGEIFENFICSLFNQKSGRFIKIDPSSADAMVYGSQAASLAFPDLKFLFKSKEKWPFRFAVECKWRKCFHDGYITWATDVQLRNYMRFQKSNNILVFVAIGIGGLPSDPEKLFVTPLDMLGEKIHLTEKDLLPYNRYKNRRFFLDMKQRMLF